MIAAALRVAVVALIAFIEPFGATAAAADVEPASDQAVSQKATALLSDPRSPVIGNLRGDVVVIEFFDYACPYCKAVEPRLETLLKSDKGTKLIHLPVAHHRSHSCFDNGSESALLLSDN
jgi:protein-disulfide isomerase